VNWIFWHNIVSPHLAPLIRALASIPEQTVTVVAWETLSDERKALGWDVPDCSPARVVVGPGDTEIERLIKERADRQSVHLLGGVSRASRNRKVLSYLARTDAIVGQMSETADKGTFRGARRLKYRSERYFLEGKLDFILAMGQLGVHWFESAGYDSSRIFPFGYVTERPVAVFSSRRRVTECGAYRILFLGRIIRLKDGITAIRALAGLSASDWQFEIVGNGPDLPRWKRAAATCGLAERVRFRPTIANREIGNLLEHADLLLLPSKWDGWGAVVNEALMCGVPVVCSDRCGAGDLLRESWRGSIFKTGSVESLRNALWGWVEHGKCDEQSRARIREWSSAIEGPQMAQYLFDVVQYVRDGGQRPSPQWY